MTKRNMGNGFFQSLGLKKVAAITAMLAIFVTVLSLVVYEGTKKNVTIEADGKTMELKTHAKTVEDVLAKRDIEIGSHDTISPSAETSIKDGMAIDWKQAKPVAINMNDDSTTIWTTESSVQDILTEAGVELSDHDSVEPSLDSKVGDQSEITIDKAFEFTLKDGSKSKKVWATSTTVADFLKNENIQLSKLDRIEGDKDQVLSPESVVSIVRVEKVSDVVEETTNFDVKKRTDDSLLKGREKVVREGEKGKVRKRFEIVKENGKEVSRKLIREHVVAHPKNKVVSVGSKVVLADASAATKKTAKTAKTAAKGAVKTSASTKSVSRGNGNEPGKVMYMNATAYTAHCTGCSGITATGINLNANPNLKVIAVDPGVIPLGSKVWVEGYGYAVAGDTGGAIKGNRIDLHVPNDAAARKFGRRSVKVKVLN
ncbi:ubiquitin-like domain-containing protein [Sporosarcina aquimarina]|uniref:Ubiquitin-like domain-containing protein n=1 Tax=Sporosarcina aquimarina TaxID=114975 RepID=A0ABU4G318_9BACL|nr:ubiquitin-like domain-containing protein [Sporosarcina aquimarina]MDW0111366.1 ubiquitin-like domain-containing protein [Sporosarcina aquimarina]